MITSEPNKFVAEVHDRIPVLLPEKDYKPWLSGKAVRLQKGTTEKKFSPLGRRNVDG
jgi:putative SOS response-associated peptidase YedK